MSKKVKLSLDSLQVESFATHAPSAPRGTVEGHMSFDASCGETWCGQFSCAGTCGQTEWGDCGGGGGLSADCYTRYCTANPLDAKCALSRRYCSEAEPCLYTIDFTCTQ